MFKAFLVIWTFIFLGLLVLSLFGCASMQVLRWISPVGRSAFNVWIASLPNWLAIVLVGVGVSGLAAYSQMKFEARLDVEIGKNVARIDKDIAHALEKPAEYAAKTMDEK